MKTTIATQELKKTKVTNSYFENLLVSLYEESRHANNKFVSCHWSCPFTQRLPLCKQTRNLRITPGTASFSFLSFLSECSLVAYFCLANPEGLGKEIGRLGLSNVPTRKLHRGKDQVIWWATLRDDKEKHYSLKDSVRSFSF